MKTALAAYFIKTSFFFHMEIVFYMKPLSCDKNCNGA